MIKKEDLRVIKTRKNIEETFLELLDTVPFEKITVKLIIEHALISKGTFYSHYLDKYDLAQKVIDRYLDKFRKDIKDRLEKVNSQISYETLWGLCEESTYRIINDIKRFKKINMDDFDIEFSIKRIWEEEYENCIENINGDKKNIKLKSSIVAFLAMDFIDYIQENGEMINMHDYIQSVNEISGQYLSCFKGEKM